MSTDLANFECRSCGMTMTGPKDEPQCEACGQTCVEICPLPRIGSKEWGWIKRHENKYAAIVHTQKFGGYYIKEFNTCEVYKEGSHYGVADLTDLATAKRVAELLARRDWRKANRGKNGSREAARAEESPSPILGRSA